MSDESTITWTDVVHDVAAAPPARRQGQHDHDRQLDALDERVDQALAQFLHESPSEAGPVPPATTSIWGLPLAKLSLADTLTQIDRLVQAGDPGYFITANLNWAMLTDQRAELRQVNREAAFITCDGMPMYWWSLLKRDPLPERVPGSELVYAIAKWAAAKQYRIFLLGGAADVARAAARGLAQRYPKLAIAGVESPPFRPLSADEETRLVSHIRSRRPDILFVALGQPKGELWLAKHCRDLGVPVAVQLGASFDFVAGRVPRAPRWTQTIGMEWLYRTYHEPRRMVRRYGQNAKFLWKAVLRDLARKGDSGLPEA